MGYGDDREPIVFVDDIVDVVLIEVAIINSESDNVSKVLSHKREGVTWNLVGCSWAVNNVQTE